MWAYSILDEFNVKFTFQDHKTQASPSKGDICILMGLFMPEVHYKGKDCCLHHWATAVPCAAVNFDQCKPFCSNDDFSKQKQVLLLGWTERNSLNTDLLAQQVQKPASITHPLVLPAQPAIRACAKPPISRAGSHIGKLKTKLAFSDGLME